LSCCLGKGGGGREDAIHSPRNTVNTAQIVFGCFILPGRPPCPRHDARGGGVWRVRLQELRTVWRCWVALSDAVKTEEWPAPTVSSLHHHKILCRRWCSGWELVGTRWRLGARGSGRPLGPCGPAAGQRGLYLHI
jgi:hypothetical protein